MNPDIDIFGFSSLRKYYNLSYKDTKNLQRSFYEKYDCPELRWKLRSLQVNNFWSKNKNTEYGLMLRQKSKERMLENGKKSHTPEARQKAKESVIKNGNNFRSPEQREKIRQSNLGQKRSNEAKAKMSTSAKRKFENGYIHPKYERTDEIKSKLSNKIKQLWDNGHYHKSEHLFNSKGQQDLFEFLKNNFDEFRDSEPNVIKYGKSWDVFSEINKIIIEYNGTYWHCDPRFYKIDDFDEYRNLYVKQVWEKDNNKKTIAINNNFKFFIVWQYDWENLVDNESKLLFLNKLLYD